MARFLSAGIQRLGSVQAIDPDDTWATVLFPTEELYPGRQSPITWHGGEVAVFIVNMLDEGIYVRCFIVPIDQQYSFSDSGYA